MWRQAGSCSRAASVSHGSCHSSRQLLSFAGGTRTSNLFAAPGLAAINRTGRTQLRLRFANNQTSTKHVWIDKGATATLTVTYLP